LFIFGLLFQYRIKDLFICLLYYADLEEQAATVASMATVVRLEIKAVVLGDLLLGTDYK